MSFLNDGNYTTLSNLPPQVSELGSLTGEYSTNKRNDVLRCVGRFTAGKGHLLLTNNRPTWYKHGREGGKHIWIDVVNNKSYLCYDPPAELLRPNAPPVIECTATHPFGGLFRPEDADMEKEDDVCKENLAEPKSDTEEGGSPAMSSRKAPVSPQSPIGPSKQDPLEPHMCRSITSSIKANHLDCADRLLKACTTVARKLELIHAIDTATNTAEPPLHVACTYGNLPFVQFLVANGANVNKPNRDSFTALHRAAQADQPDICKYLIDHKSDPAAESNNHMTPKHVAKGSALSFLFTITPPPQTAEQQEHQPQEQHEHQEQMPPPPPPPRQHHPQHHPQHRQSPRTPQRPMGSPGGFL